MVKKILVIVMVLCFATIAVSAKLISFGFGAHALLPKDNADVVEEWAFGGEVRLKVLFAEGVISALYEPDNRTASLVTVGTSMNLFGLLHVGLGVGPAFSLEESGKEVHWAYMDTDQAYQAAPDLGSAFDQGLIHYRAHGDIKVGRLSFGLTYQVPSQGFTLNDNDVAKLGPAWGDGRIGTSLLFWLF